MQALNYQEAIQLFSQRLKPDDTTLFADVQKVLDEVRSGGDKAALALTLKFDGVKLKTLRVSPKGF